jgi:hypothetical protein
LSLGLPNPTQERRSVYHPSYRYLQGAKRIDPGIFKIGMSFLTAGAKLGDQSAFDRQGRKTGASSSAVASRRKRDIDCIQLGMRIRDTRDKPNDAGSWIVPQLRRFASRTLKLLDRMDAHRSPTNEFASIRMFCHKSTLCGMRGCYLYPWAIPLFEFAHSWLSSFFSSPSIPFLVVVHYEVRRRKAKGDDRPKQLQRFLEER